METIEGPRADELVPPETYAESRPHLFPRPSSMPWFIRVHKARLIEGGALVLVGGRWLASPRHFDRVAVAVGREAAEAA